MIDSMSAEAVLKLAASAALTDTLLVNGRPVPRWIGEFWTARQRQACALHEVPYRACFKPQLPRYFIERLTQPGDWVYDPFSGRGTTALEAALLCRQVVANDVNPLSTLLTAPRLRPAEPAAVRDRLQRIPRQGRRAELDLSMFYHPATEREIVALRDYLAARRAADEEDEVDAWIRMVATTRLSGHSPGFFSVYTLPPNQATCPARQRQINARLGQTPEYRDTHALILRKTASLLRDLTHPQRSALRSAAQTALLLTKDARSTPEIADESIQLIVTSPPFLDLVQYAEDNWLRCWFNGIDPQMVAQQLTIARSLGEWLEAMRAAFAEFHRVLKPGGWVAFEVGEVRRGTLRLDEHIAPIGESVGFVCQAVLVNQQRFTKTANIWGIANNRAGVNTNRIVLFRKP